MKPLYPNYPYVERGSLRVGAELASFIDNEALPGTGVEVGAFWAGFAAILADLTPPNRELLSIRVDLQARIDRWHQENPRFELSAYRGFLEAIGYIVPTGPSFSITTENTDAEIAEIPGPQLVVPVTNARYALNAANARWGSLYDALYGTDALGDTPKPGPYDPQRGARVIEWSRSFLDEVAPLADGSHRAATGYFVADAELHVRTAHGSTTLRDPLALVGYTGNANNPPSILLEHHGLGVEIVIDGSHNVGRDDPAHIADVRLESALTTIVDFEDSVATVDSDDKTDAYRNWLGLMNGTASASFTKDGRSIERTLNGDLTFTAPDGSTITRAGRALMLVRNVGHLMTTPAVLDTNGDPIPEGLLDAVVTVLCAMHDVRGTNAGVRNSRSGSIYIVKPKMHGPVEVAFADETFTRVEQLLGLAPNTVKLGIMDEERRTTLNLAECVRAAKARIAFINTGFLDRTGDEIHTSMRAGAMVRKNDMRSEIWLKSYEDWNVDTGIACGLLGRAQIGKGMWAMPDLMAAMLDQKIAHPQAGASCAWVPSPTAATLHAIHYHRVDVKERQKTLSRAIDAGQRRAEIDDLLQIPVSKSPDWTTQQIQDELDNNAQGILGYVVRWVDQGVGCSKVPNLHGVGLMEDRATCRISSQHIANWLLHRVITTQQVGDAFRRMAVVVDSQNASDPLYVPMAPSYDGIAFRAAYELVMLGTEQPSGYTEPILHDLRRERKAQR